MRLPSRHQGVLAGRGRVGFGASGGGGGSSGKINVTPLIDVVMCLIVFYLIVAKLASDRQLPLDLPEARQGIAEESQRPIIISVAPGGIGATAGVTIEVQGREIAGDDAAQLALVRDAVAREAKERPDAPVHLRADRALEYAKVRPVVEACRQAGVRSLLLVAARDEAKGVAR